MEATLSPRRIGHRPLRVMLADPPVGEEHYIYYQPTMGILYLLGALKRAFPRTEVEIRYLQGFGDMSDHLAEVEDFAPDLYGLSFKTPMARLGYRTLAAVKQRFPSLPVIAGGSHVSIMADDVMARTPVGRLCAGGMRRQRRPASWRISRTGSSRLEEVAGAVYRTGRLDPQRNPPSPFPERSRRLSPGPRGTWSMSIAFRECRTVSVGRISASSSAGAVRFQCTFCSEPVWKIFGRPTYQKPGLRKTSSRRSVTCTTWGFARCDSGARSSTPTADWALELLRGIADTGTPRDLFFNFNIRGAVMSRTLADAMAAANVWLVTAGLEDRVQPSPGRGSGSMSPLGADRAQLRPHAVLTRDQDRRLLPVLLRLGRRGTGSAGKRPRIVVRTIEWALDLGEPRHAPLHVYLDRHPSSRELRFGISRSGTG